MPCAVGLELGVCPMQNKGLLFFGVLLVLTRDSAPGALVAAVLFPKGCGVDFARVTTSSSCVHLRSPKPVATRECLPHTNRGDRAYVVCCSLAHDVVLQQDKSGIPG